MANELATHFVQTDGSPIVTREHIGNVLRNGLPIHALGAQWVQAALKTLEDDFDFHAHLRAQRVWSEQTFGPGDHTAGLLDHLRKELAEIKRDPSDLYEWIDVVILALDGAWRAGYTPEQISAALRDKSAQNRARKWPDWRTAEPGKAIEHVRE